MIDKKDSFIVRKKYWNQIQKLTANQKAEFMECMFSYQNGWSYESEDGAICMLLDIMIDERQNDEERYLEVCERNKENGKLGWRPPKNRKNPVGLEKPKKADNDSDSDIEEKEISKDISKKKSDTFETFWKEYPHARKWKKQESEKFFVKQNSDEVMKQVSILKWKLRAWLEESKRIPACERRIRDFTPLNDDVIKQDLFKICKRHLNAWWDMKQRSLELKETFGEQQINEIVKSIQQKDKSLF